MTTPLLLALLLTAPDAGAAKAAAPAPAAAPAASPTAAADGAPAEFGEEVKLLFQIVTCQEGKLPDNLDPKVVEGYCKTQKPRFQRFKDHWGTTAVKFLGELHPEELPTELVYPFGGGDLMMALASFPQSTAITTLSLELAGDPRRLKTLTDKKALEQSLRVLLNTSNSTLVSNDSLSTNLSKGQKGELPGQLSMHLIGLGLFDYVPVSARYFKIEDDGKLHYFTGSEIAALEGNSAAALSKVWASPDFSPAFANVEVQYVHKDKPDGPRRIHRHIGADLSDDGVKKAPGVLAHLNAKGQVTTMTKAASYLLWRTDFAQIRDYLLTHSRFMLSDSTGILPRHWKKTKCPLKTYGTFSKSFLSTTQAQQDELKAEYEAQPKRRIPMRFGYPDGSPEKTSHLMIASCPKEGG